MAYNVRSLFLLRIFAMLKVDTMKPRYGSWVTVKEVELKCPCLRSVTFIGVFKLVTYTLSPLPTFVNSSHKDPGALKT